MYNNKILGGIAGDIIGSTREWRNVKTEDFELFPIGSQPTDDSIIMHATVGTQISPRRLWWHVPRNLPTEIQEKCRQLLPSDLLEINDRFMAFINRPLFLSYEVNTGKGGGVYAGEYPGDKRDEVATAKIKQMLHFGITHFMTVDETLHVLQKAFSMMSKSAYRDAPETSVQIRFIENFFASLKPAGLA